MLPQVVVAITALILTTLATAIAVWECARQHKIISAPELHDDIRLDAQVVLPGASSQAGAELENVPSQASHQSHQKSPSQISSREVESGLQVQSAAKRAPTVPEDRYSNAV
ncbi:hypothetical protein DHEL01_v207147 [Diaporthe helianthi]|uniref:Secreted protein n=1 Tax=Diaporthe helianthi TaxID=158607 RepID=A0A2P5HW49_DIAHE|nr:hypothetical protein DHEL01_v207147 [Diaporthe helianthi]